MTQNSHKALQSELKKLKSEDRFENVREIEEARAHGDLSENAEYHAAKERQGHIAGRIAMLEDKLARAQVIDTSTQEPGQVRFGAIVVLSDIDSDEQVTYRIVGEDEADPKEGRISVTSPVARALLNKQVGDEVLVKAPKGNREFAILELRYE